MFSSIKEIMVKKIMDVIKEINRLRKEINRFLSKAKEI